MSTAEAAPAAPWEDRGAFRPPSRVAPIGWTDEMISRLGEDPDAQIAADIGLEVDTVARTRQKLGLPLVWRRTPEEIVLLGTLSDANVARKTGRAVRKRRRRLGIRCG